MELTDEHVEWLRAQINGNETAMRQIMSRLSRPGDLDPLAPLVYHAFVIAVRKAFGAHFTHGDVVRLVANIRTALVELPEAVDPVAAESEIRRALGDPAPEFPDPNARTAVQITVLDYLVHDWALDDGQIRELLRQASQMTTDAQPSARSET